MSVCFLVTAKGEARRSLRRYTVGTGSFTCAEGSHDASVLIDRVPIALSAPNEWGRRGWDYTLEDEWPHDDPRWPGTCAKCDYRFADSDAWQLFWEPIYVDVDGGEHLLRDGTPGMMWNADWMPADWRGADGNCYVLVLPNGRDWMIDGRASNCTSPDDTVHRCWIRHGVAPKLTVDKVAGTADASAPTTCAAGAGSILAGDFHGFLRDGVVA